MELTQVLLKPFITEKSMNEAASGWYTFAVARRANKYEIKKAVESQFKVNVLAVKTLTIKGKSQRVGRRRVKVKESPWKKARVLLGPEQKIELFEAGK